MADVQASPLTHEISDSSTNNLSNYTPFAPSQIIETSNSRFSPSEVSLPFIVQNSTVFPSDTHPSFASVGKRPIEWVYQQNPPPPGEERPRKKIRQTKPRADKACMRCRKRKQKCMGRPSCENCIHNEVVCTFAREHATVDNTNRPIKLGPEQAAVVLTSSTAQSQQQIPVTGPAISTAVIKKNLKESRTSLLAMQPQEHGYGTAAGSQDVNTSLVLQQQKALKTIRFRCYFDENLIGIVKSGILDPVQLNSGCDFADAVTMAGKL